MKSFQPYQPLVLRILHGLTGLFAIAAMISAFWTYNVYDGRWGTLPLPRFEDIEGIHGTFGLFTLLIFPLFVLYAFHRGQKKLIQSDSLSKVIYLGKPIWWYTLHRSTNTLMILALTFALFSGKMMDEKWLPKGELEHRWYYVYLISWLVLIICLALHLLMSIKVGGIPLLNSMLTRQFRHKDSPVYWINHFSNWRKNYSLELVRQWWRSFSILEIIEIIVLVSIAMAWIISLFKEFG